MTFGNEQLELIIMMKSVKKGAQEINIWSQSIEEKTFFWGIYQNFKEKFMVGVGVKIVLNQYISFLYTFSMGELLHVRIKLYRMKN